MLVPPVGEFPSHNALIKHVLSINNPNYNHEPSNNLLAHPSFRRLDNQSLERLNTMSKASVHSRQIVSSFNQSGSIVALQDIYNAHEKLHREYLQR
ncbi:16733_t:CDS:2 [Cetraspora pellucida]|uniref:16733_t:CDS:1 n=1 Tax=Cetraspora pellucida TaxID=1433469 RepID=A0A9N9DY86_9GLOM|nr:16733_t:CDS:2 [Cetraspora pellucida]